MQRILTSALCCTLMLLAQSALATPDAIAALIDSKSQTSATNKQDDALGSFVKNDHKGCLDDLRFLLDQHPDDVNALFYSGLCAYNLGLYDRARGFLQRAAGHPVDVFDEEAAWYYALTLDRLKDPGAHDAFQRIANGDGFYSELAKGRITAH